MRKLSPILLSLFFIISCTKEVDFNQISDIEISPVVESSLIFFTASANDFIQNNQEVSLSPDFIEVDVFNNSFVNDNVNKVDLVFETENTLPRDFSFSIDFFSENGQFLENFTFLTTEASPHVITFEDTNLRLIKNTSVLLFSLTMLNGDLLSDTTEGRIALKSKAVFYFNIEG
ncbi:hypothetical protein N1F78_03530 [Seonamhaeicola sp. MEBiC1930]|uniref:hypothetical protein n=1 Tax=Seonamhaeicola sp. MEBiC01930 TaxID=2976768 RepID=UPI003245FEE8